MVGGVMTVVGIAVKITIMAVHIVVPAETQ